MLAVRVRGPSGTSTLKLDDGALVRDLIAALSSSTGIASGSQEVRLGHPPKPIDLSSPDAPLRSVGVVNGETLIVSSIANTSSAPAVSTPLAPSKPHAVAPSKPQSFAAAPRPPAPAAKAKKPPTRVTAVFGDHFLVLRPVPDDNSCLFHAASLVLNVRGGASELRRIVVDAIRADPITYDEATLGQSPESYARRMLESSAWGGAIELAALSNHFQTEIDSVDVQTGRIDRFGEGRFTTRHLVIYAGIHYDAVTASYNRESEASWPYAGDALAFDVLSFDAADDSVLVAAQSIADQLRKVHAYTDTATFALRCGDCGIGLKGEKEAREHASTTSHTNFVEYE